MEKFVDDGNKSYTTSDPVMKYINEHSLRLHPVQEKLIQATLKLQMYRMLGSTDEIQLLSNFVKYMGCKKTLDIGVFTGYSALSIALSLPDDGLVVACDVNEEWTNIGKQHWKEAGVDHKIRLVLAPASETIKNLIDKGESGTFDFAFIDADKTGYDQYYEMCLKLMRPGGLIAIDNTLYAGKVLDPSDSNENTVAIRALNDKLLTDERVDISMLSVGDGTTLAFKKK